MSFSEYQGRTHETAVYPDDDARVTMLYIACGLAGEAGEIANKVKKIVRDQKGVVTDAERAAIKREMGDVLWYCSELATFFGINLADAAAANLLRLGDRAARGTLQGSGDER